MADTLVIKHAGDSSQNAITWENTRPLPDLGDVPAPHTAILTRGNLNQLTANRATQRGRLTAAEVALGGYDGADRIYGDTYISSEDQRLGWTLNLGGDLPLAGYTIAVVTRAGDFESGDKTLVLGPDSSVGSTVRGFNFILRNGTALRTRHATPDGDGRVLFSLSKPGSVALGEWALVSLRWIRAGETNPDTAGAVAGDGHVEMAWCGPGVFGENADFGIEGNEIGTLEGPIGLIIPDFNSSSGEVDIPRIAAVFAWDVPVSRAHLQSFNTLIKPWLASFDVDIAG